MEHTFTDIDIYPACNNQPGYTFPLIKVRLITAIYYKWPLCNANSFNDSEKKYFTLLHSHETLEIQLNMSFAHIICAILSRFSIFLK